MADDAATTTTPDPTPTPETPHVPDPTPEPAAPEADAQADGYDDDFSDLFGDEVDDDPAADPPPAVSAPAEAEEPDFEDPNVVREVWRKQQELEKRIDERDRLAAASAQERAEARLARSIDKTVIDLKMTKPELAQVVKYARSKGLEQSLVSGKVSFREVAEWANPGFKDRARPSAPPASAPAAGGERKASPAAPPAPPAKPSNGAARPATFAEAEAQARTEFVGKLITRQ